MYAAAWVCNHLAVRPVSLIQPWRSPCRSCRSCCPEPVCLMVLHLCESTKENEQKNKAQKKQLLCLLMRQHPNTSNDEYMQCDHGVIRSTPCHTMPCHTIPYHTIPHHTTPHHTTPHHTIPYHTISYPALLYPNQLCPHYLIMASANTVTSLNPHVRLTKLYILSRAMQHAWQRPG